MIRLKSYSTVGYNSFIEVFESGYKRSIQSKNVMFVEKILNLVEICDLLNYNHFKNLKDVPNWLQIQDKNTYLSISQRLLCVATPLIYIRKKYKFNYNILIYLNSVSPAIGDIIKITNYLLE